MLRSRPAQRSGRGDAGCGTSPAMNAAGPGSKPRGRGSSLIDGLSGRQPGHLADRAARQSRSRFQGQARVSDLLASGERLAVSDLVRMEYQVGPIKANDAALLARYAILLIARPGCAARISSRVRSSRTDLGAIRVQTSGLLAPGRRRRAWLHALSEQRRSVKEVP